MPIDKPAILISVKDLFFKIFLNAVIIKFLNIIYRAIDIKTKSYAKSLFILIYNNISNY